MPMINEIDSSAPRLQSYAGAAPSDSPSIHAIISTLNFDEQDVSVDTTTTKPIGFCSRDPIGYEGSEWNLYEYVSSNPLNLVDPFGELEAVTTTTTIIVFNPANPVSACLETALVSFSFGYAVSNAVSPCVTEIVCHWSISANNPPPPQRGCLPCSPALGMVMYEIVPPGSRTRGRHANPGSNSGHVKTWTVLQSPHPKCECFWSKPTTIENTQTPPPNSIPGGPPTTRPGGGGPI